jgi:2-oxoglutarate ferredoxin oxidoreductase subunit beta
LTGLIYVDPNRPTLIDLLNLVDEPLATLPLERVRPPREALEQIMEELR